MSEILNKKRKLTVEMMRSLRKRLLSPLNRYLHERGRNEIINEEFLKPLGLPATRSAKAIGVPPNRITANLKGERGTSQGPRRIRLGTFFKTSAEFWANLQMTYDLRNAEVAAGWMAVRAKG